MDENLQDVAADISADEIDTQSSQESGSEDTTDLVEQLEKQRKANLQILARAKKAEDELKKFKSTPAPSQVINNNNPEFSDELKLIARGLSDEEISQAKVIAKGKGVVLSEAIKDPMFSLFQKDLKERERRENARLGGSRGSGESTDDSLIKPNMTKEEHQEAFKKMMGN